MGFEGVEGQIITTVAGNTPSGFLGTYTGDGVAATASSLSTPISVALDAIGNLYIADEGNGRVRMVDTSGIIQTIAGNGLVGFRGDDSVASLSEFCDLGYIFISDNGLYVPDICNNRLRKIDLSTQIISTFAGNGSANCNFGSGIATVVNVHDPFCADADEFGNIYLSDVCNYVCKIGADGFLQKVAGSDSLAGYSGDLSSAITAKLNHPVDVAHDPFGNMYISDLNNNVIRKVDTAGMITTFAGTGFFGYSGDNGPATTAHLCYPEGITSDGEGNIYFSDCGNNVVRRIDYYTNVITTVVGNGYGAGSGGSLGGFSGDNGPATAAEIYGPGGLTFDKYGNLYIADWLNNRIRKVTNVGVPLRQPAVVKPEIVLTIYPSPAKNTVSVACVQGCTCDLIDLLGRVQMTFFCAADKQSIDVSSLPPGQYIVEAISSDGQRRRVRMCKGG